VRACVTRVGGGAGEHGGVAFSREIGVQEARNAGIKSRLNHKIG